MQERRLIGLYVPVSIGSPFRSGTEITWRMCEDRSQSENSRKSDDKGPANLALQDFQTVLGLLSGPVDFVTKKRC